jgi:alkaline phosphatase D
MFVPFINLSTILSLLLVIGNGVPLYFPIQAQKDNNLFIAQGVATGDVTDGSAVVWSRTNREAQMNVEYDTHYNFSQPQLMTAIADQSTDFAAHAKLTDLEPNSLYYYRVWFTTIQNNSTEFAISNIENGSFLTAPDKSTSTQVDFVISGDLGGQGFCRRNDTGYAIFALMRELSPDFFIFNGDQIYADSSCPKQGPGMTVGWHNIEGNFPSVAWKSTNWTDLVELHDIYLKHWEYNRNDTQLQRLLKDTPFYSQFDDHEVINNYGGNWSFLLDDEFKNRTGYSNLVEIGTNLFSNFAPIEINQANSEVRYYRSFTWGKSLDLFILDSRSYRSSNNVADTAENNKTLLGSKQLKWLKQGLVESNSTWKIISTPNSITIPNCSQYGCDSWATDGTNDRTFVKERSNLLKFLDANNIRNVVFVTTDVHFPANVLVHQDFDSDQDSLVFYELLSGPLSAAPINAGRLDPTINATFLYTENKIFNFGHFHVEHEQADMKEQLVYRVIDSNGVIRPKSVLSLTPR